MIEVYCFRCGKSLDEPGALAFSPPDKKWHEVTKYHICKDCWEVVKIAFEEFSPPDKYTP